MLLVVGAIFVALALASFASDPAVPEVQGANWVGPVGASIAHFFVAAVGVGAWAVPVELVLMALPLLRERPNIGSLARLGGDLLVIFVVAALIHVALPTSTAFGAMPIAGDVGALFGELMSAMFSTVGSFLIGLTAIALVLITRASFSFINVARRAGLTTEQAAKKGVSGMRYLADAWARARNMERRRALEQQEPEEPIAVDASLGEEAILPNLQDELADVAEQAAVTFDLDAEPVVLPDPSEEQRVVDFDSPTREDSSMSQPPPAAATVSSSEDFAADESPRDAVVVEEPGDEETPARHSKREVDASVANENPPEESAPTSKSKRKRRQLASSGSQDPAVPSSATTIDAHPRAIVRVTPAVASNSQTDELPDEDDEAGMVDQQPEKPELDDLGSFVDEHEYPDPPSGEDDPDLAESGSIEPPSEGKGASATPQVIDTSDVRQVLRDDQPAAKPQAAPAVPAYQFPPVSLLDARDASDTIIDEELERKLNENAKDLVTALGHYGVKGVVREILPGPTVTTYELEPAAGTKVSKIAGLADDLAMNLGRKVRIIAPIPGKKRVGFEVPNDTRTTVSLRELVEDKRFQNLKSPLPVVLGRDIVGSPFYADLSTMPHLLVAGATGAGKSVGLNVMLVSLLYRKTPEELRMLMIDPKVVELQSFDGLPHMLLPVVTDTKKAAVALKWAVDEMERRYQLLADSGTKNIKTYNAWVQRVLDGKVPGYAAPKTIVSESSTGVTIEQGPEREPPPLPEKLPYILLVIDEFADLMMQQGKEVEAAIARLAQKARAAGMHIILATQRPSVDVITGMIKANFPTRIAFKVTQRIDSRTILDEQGAEHLLGRGDMLVKLNGRNDTMRVQCPFVSEEEVDAVASFLRKQGKPEYNESILEAANDEQVKDTEDAEDDPKYDEALRIVAETRRCSTSWLQRKLGIGYNRAARIVEVMEARGVVGPAIGAKNREVLIDPL